MLVGAGLWSVVDRPVQASCSTSLCVCACVCLWAELMLRVWGSLCHGLSMCFSISGHGLERTFLLFLSLFVSNTTRVCVQMGIKL